MKSIEEIYSFLSAVQYYILAEYGEDYVAQFKDYNNSIHIDYILTDHFVFNSTIPHTAGKIIDILKKIKPT